MRVPPGAVIGLIRENLNDRYRKGFPIVRELIQNADDAAFATHLHLGWVRSLPRAVHPLLQGPALFFVNDGEFSEKDRLAIDCIGVSSKSSNRSSVGKFGLGLKSIFHLCEAFFYIALDGQPKRQTAAIVNPWTNTYGKDSLHHGWDGFSATDQEAIMTYLGRILPPERYFCLWIPLRRQDHLQDRHAITPDYPGDTDRPPVFWFQDMEAQLASLFPMLQRVRSITGWYADSNAEIPQSAFHIQLSDTSNQRRYPYEDHLNDRRDLVGETEIVTGSDDIPKICRFGGFEILYDDPRFTELRGSDRWPQSGGTDPLTGDYDPGPDKADPHSAVYFAKYPPANGRTELIVSRCVFLPVDEPFPRVALDTDHSYILTLHGYFFVDAGRSRIEGWDTVTSLGDPQDERSLRNEWNGQLAQRGTLPLILPALDRFIKHTVLPHGEILALTDGLSKSGLFAEQFYRSHICRESQWIYCVTKEGGAWRLLEAHDRVLEIPFPPASDPERPFSVLPHLADFQYVTYCGYTRLAANDSADWSERQLLRVLDIDAKSVFAKQTNLEYLVKFLKNVGQAAYATSVQDQLCQLVREAFRCVDLAQLRKHKGLIQSLLHFVPAHRRVSLQYHARFSGSSALSSVVAALAKLELEVLFVPDGFDNETSPSESQITSTDAAMILRCLADPEPRWFESAGFGDLRTHLALRVTEATKPSEERDLRRCCGDLSILKGFDCHSNRSIALSWNQLNQLLEKRFLFRYSERGDHHGLARELQNSLADAHVILVATEMASLISELVPCTEQACIETLATCPGLERAGQRAELLEVLVKRIELGDLGRLETKKGLRYLLHGQKHHAYSDAPLLINADKGTHGVWTKIVRHVLSLRTDEWRLVDTELTDRLNTRQKEELGIQEIDQKSAESILQTVARLDQLNLAFDIEERNTLLREMQDLDTLKSLPIHEDIGGNLVSIGQNTYLQSESDVGEELGQVITIIRRNSDHMIAAKQEKDLQIPVLTAQEVIGIALSQADPELYCDIIMDALGKSQNLAPTLISDLQQKAWLPTRDGRSINPNSVIHISKIENEVNELLAVLGHQQVGTLTLHKDITNHPAFGFLTKEVFSSRGPALAALGQAMSKDEQYGIGLIDESGFVLEDLTDFLNTFEEAPAEVMPARRWIKLVYERISPDLCLKHLLPHLVVDISAQRIATILGFLSVQHGSSRRSQKQVILKVHRWYLAAAKKKPDFEQSILPHIELLNRRGQWRPTAKLCFGVPGIDDGDLLSDEQGEIIKPARVGPVEMQAAEAESFEHEALTGSLPRQIDDTVHRLEEYFGNWEGYVDRELIGGFLCFLGNHPDLRGLAQRYLGKWDVDKIREMLKWRPRRQTGWTNQNAERGTEQGIQEAMDSHRYIVQVAEIGTETHPVPSLLGPPFDARLSNVDDLSDLFVGDFLRFYNTRYRIYSVCLRRIRPRDFQRERLSDLLKESTAKVVSDFYRQDASNIDQVWSEISQSEQLDIEIAQDLLIEAAFFHLPQYGLRTNRYVGPLLKRWQSAHNREVQEARVRIVGGKSVRASGRQGKLDVQQELRLCLLNERDVRHAILDAVRSKMGSEYQYRRSSILFELFQNADDAVVELANMRGDSHSLSKVNRTVTVLYDNKRVVFVHHGRRINQYRGVGAFDGRGLGYDDDLRKMLVLQDSDKPAPVNEASVTGKFGLGFKSVFLISDCPKVVSGKLGFEIVGGIYPFPPDESIGRLRREFGSAPHEMGTIFELPIDDRLSPPVDTDQVTHDFRRLAHILLVFSRQIRCCEVWTKTRAKHVVSWEKHSLLDIEGVYVGSLQPILGVKNAAIVFEARHGALLLELGEYGVRAFPKDVPTVWVTTPTQERLNLGFVVNGAFDVDVGRAQLARASSRNEELAQNIGDAIGDLMCQLFSAVQGERNWSRFVDEMDSKAGIKPAMKPYVFWLSLWKCLAEPLSIVGDSNVVSILSETLWGSALERRGMGQLVTEYAALPTGLWSCHRVLTQLSKVKYVARDCLDTDKVFTVVSDWPSFVQRLRPGTVISTSVGRTIDKLLPGALKCDKLSLCQIVSWEVGQDGNIDPDTATRLGTLITREWILKLGHPEDEELEEQLRTVRFLAKDGRYRPASELLVPPSKPDQEEEQGDYVRRDERMRARFAPDNRILGDGYQGAGLLFFEACRQRLEANVETMTEWALAAGNDHDKQLGVIEYLRSGDLSRQLAAKLRTYTGSTWLFDLDEESLRQQFSIDDINDRLMVRAQLGLIVSPPPIIPSQQYDPQIVLPRIYYWWRTRQSSYVQHYERLVYPDDILRVDTSDFDPGSQLDREKWLILLLLGSFHTMGRTSPKQHQSFLQRCRRKGWIRIFADPETEPYEWMRILDEYIQDEWNDTLLFYEWMKQYVSIYQLARRLSEYVESFLAVKSYGKPFRLTEITSLRTSEQQQRGGPDAPSISRTLGIGACFVMRELVRNRVLTSPYAYRHCYAPTRRLRELMMKLGCEIDHEPTTQHSIEIHRFLVTHLGEEKATFDLSFDLPFLAILDEGIPIESLARG